MINMKTVLNVLGTNKIKRTKCIGRNGKKDGGHLVGETVSLSVKAGEFATQMSRKGTKHKAIIVATKFRKNSLLVPGIKDICYNKNSVFLIDNNKKAPVNNVNSIGIPVHSELKLELEKLAKSAKRKDTYNFPMV